jgi:splicing factor 3B subunit 2
MFLSNWVRAMVHKGQAEQDAAGTGSEEVNALQEKSNLSKSAQTEPKKSKKRKRKKKKKKNRSERPVLTSVKTENQEEPEPEIEYVSYQPQNEEDKATYDAFKHIFEKFAPPEQLCLSKEEREKLEAEANKVTKFVGETQTTDEEKPEEEEPEQKQMSKRERKKQKRLSVALLKQLVTRPEVVEVWDVTSSDPALLVYLKSYRNAVPVPRHWCQKRKYLQGKRGIEKPPFELPEFIAATGITRIRQAIQEQEEQKRAKQKQRERMQPKMGKMDIDYQVLHDAFFRYQTKPKLTGHGDMYYEGKEFEVKLKEKKPGQLSDELKEALGMPEGAPPPWLINMQRYGPPPSYPNLKIPGLNAPIPPNAQFGYHPGGWGKPPVDQFGKPLYGDVFGVASGTEMPSEAQQQIEKKHWGEMEEEEEYSDEEESESEEEEEEEAEEEGVEEGGKPKARPPPLESGLVTPTGLATPDHLILRKKDVMAAQAPPAYPAEAEQQPLYRVLPQKEVSVGSAAFGSAHAYVISGAGAGGPAAGPGEEDKKAAKAAKKAGKQEAVNLIKSQKTKEMEFTLSATQVAELTDEKLEEMYEAEVAARAPPKEDLSDVIAEHTKKKKPASKDKKKWQDFKF